MFDLNVIAAKILLSFYLFLLVSRWPGKAAHPLVSSTFNLTFKLNNVKGINHWTDCRFADVVLVHL